MIWVRAPGMFLAYESEQRYLGYGLGGVRARGVGPGAEAIKRGGVWGDLAVPVVETVKVAEVIRWASQDAAEVLGAVGSWQGFVHAVIAPEELARGFQAEGGRRLLVTKLRLRRMRELQYIRPLRTRPEWGETCPVFFVPKEKNRERLIYNGRMLNARCRRPPEIGFVPLRKMLQRLTRPSVSGFASFDFVSWFVQLKVASEVGRAFAVQLQDGSLWRLTGVPMGWSWGPVVAQKVAQTLVDETVRRVGEDGIESFVYIDNVILAVLGEDGGSARLKRVEGIFREVCREVGAVIKEEATVIGRETDWLGVLITAGQRRARFRESFVEKVVTVDELLGRCGTVRFHWKAVALAVRALWVAGRPLGEMMDALRWLVRSAAALNAGSTTWDTVGDMWSGAKEQLRSVYSWVIREGGTFDVWEPAGPGIVAVGASDAAGGQGGARGYVWRSGKRMVVARIARAQGEAVGHINEEEFQAMCAGVKSCVASAPSGVIVWYGDNIVANAWARRTWSPEHGRNSQLIEREFLMRQRGVELRVERVGGGSRNPADGMTRSSPSNPRLLPGASWEVTMELECECPSLCGRVLKGLRELLGEEGR